jgi:hypothetical protein
MSACSSGDKIPRPVPLSNAKNSFANPGDGVLWPTTKAGQHEIAADAAAMKNVQFMMRMNFPPLEMVRRFSHNCRRVQAKSRDGTKTLPFPAIERPKSTDEQNVNQERRLIVEAKSKGQGGATLWACT